MKNNIILFGFISFILMLWFQESKKNDKNKKQSFKKFIDDIKLPLLVCCLVLLALECEPRKLGFTNSPKFFDINISQPNF
jgi:hypothetical protein